jgi:hypothetical protein
MSNYIYKNCELYHYGVPGMKWGVRRYHNSDGSFNAKGKKRFHAMTTQEALGRASATNTNRKKVIDKYDTLKTTEQRNADKKVYDAWDKYTKYVENYSNSNKDTQTKYEHDFDYTKKGKALISQWNEAVISRENVYAGSEFVKKYMKKYTKELTRASTKDWRYNPR